MVKINSFGVKWQKFLPYARDFSIRMFRISFRIFFTFIIFPSEQRKETKQTILGNMAEISGTHREFLRQNMRFNVLHKFYVDRMCARDRFWLKSGNFRTSQKFLPNARNFCIKIFTRSSLTCVTITNFANHAYFLKNQRFHITRAPK